MQIFQASHHLVYAVHDAISCGMARHLLARAVNLNDDIAVIVALAHAGFGADSIRALRRAAVDKAAANAIEAQVH